MTEPSRVWKSANLDLVQPTIWKRSYEMRDGDNIVCTMKFVSLFSRELRVEVDSTTWGISQKGLFKPIVTVREWEKEKPLATIPLVRSKGIYTLKLPRYRSARLKVNIWKSEYALTTTMNAKLCTLTLSTMPSFSGSVVLDPEAEILRDYPWLVCVVVFVSMINRQRHSA